MPIELSDEERMKLAGLLADEAKDALVKSKLGLRERCDIAWELIGRALELIGDDEP